MLDPHPSARASLALPAGPPQETQGIPPATDAAPVSDGLGERAADGALGVLQDIGDWFLTNGVDGVGLVVLIGFALLGAWHGLWWQVIRLIGLLGAVLAARGLSPDFARWIEARWTSVDPLIVSGSAWLLIFLAGLALAVLIGRLGKRLLEALELSMLDRFGGLLAGLATGTLLHAAGVAVLLQLSPGGWSEEHIRGSQSEALVQLLGDRASVLFDQSTAMALESRRGAEVR